MAKKKKKMSENQRLVKNQKNRIKRVVRELTKAGFDVDIENLIPQQTRATKAHIQRLKAITPAVIRKQAKIYDLGEVLTYDEVKARISTSIKKPTKTQVLEYASQLQQIAEPIELGQYALDVMLGQIAALPAKISYKLLPIIHQYIAQYGEQAVYNALTSVRGTTSLFEKLNAKQYDSETATEEYASDILDALNVNGNDRAELEQAYAEEDDFEWW